MPTYDYHCAKCKTTYEAREGFDAPSTHKCQECGKGTARRVLTAPRIVFKGSGWYATDSKSKSSAVADSSDSSDSGDTKPAKDTKTPDSASTKTDSKASSSPESSATAS